MKIGIDKLWHFCVCFVVAFFVACLANLALYSAFPVLRGKANVFISMAIAFVVALAIGVYKEVKDSKQTGNHFCWKDLLADAIGAAIGSQGAWFTLLLDVTIE